MAYTIQHKETGDFFGGFVDGAARWVHYASDAWQSDRLMANAQAALLICHGIPAQRKVIAL